MNLRNFAVAFIVALVIVVAISAVANFLIWRFMMLFKLVLLAGALTGAYWLWRNLYDQPSPHK